MLRARGQDGLIFTWTESSSGEGKSDYLLGPQLGADSNERAVAVRRVLIRMTRLGVPIRQDPVGWNEERELCGNDRVTEHIAVAHSVLGLPIWLL